jgi:hypothetical protein
MHPCKRVPSLSLCFAHTRARSSLRVEQGLYGGMRPANAAGPCRSGPHALLRAMPRRPRAGPARAQQQQQQDDSSIVPSPSSNGGCPLGFGTASPSSTDSTPPPATGSGLEVASLPLPPGDLGLPLLGETLAFAKDRKGFVAQRGAVRVRAAGRTLLGCPADSTRPEP